MSGKMLGQRLPLFAILRGLEPARAVAVAAALVESGFDIIEVPMNSPDPIDSIARIATAFSASALIGAGTVTSVCEVDQVMAAGGRLIVSPHCDPALIRHAAALGMTALAGVFTPTDMFAACAAGASGLKIFPAEIMPPAGVRAVRAVLPAHIPIYVVGGIREGNMRDYLAAGATGFGLGGSLFRPGKDIAAIKADATAIVAAFHRSLKDMQT